MNQFDCNELKGCLNEIKVVLNEIKGQSSQLVDTIEKGEFLSEELSYEICDTINSYKNKYVYFLEKGRDFSITTNSSIAEAEQSIINRENEIKLSKDRELVLDYLRLTTDMESAIKELEASKELLVEKCRAGETCATGLKPFEIVVASVKTGIELSDDDFDVVDEGISKAIARAADKGKLIIDESIDTSNYLDDSCELLISESIENESLSVSVVPCSVESIDIETEEPIDTTIENNADDIDDVFRSNELQGDFLEDYTLELSDVPANEFSSTRFFSEIKNKGSEILYAFKFINAVKIYFPDSRFPNGRKRPTKEICEYLEENGYIVKGKIFNDKDDSLVFYTISSKGNVIFNRKDTIKYLNQNFGKNYLSQFSNFILPNSITSEYVQQIFLLNTFFVKKHFNTSYYISDDVDYPCAYCASLKKYVFAFISHNKDSFSKMINYIIDREKNHGIGVLIYKSEESIVNCLIKSILPDYQENISTYYIDDLNNDSNKDSNIDSMADVIIDSINRELTWENVGIEDSSKIIFNEDNYTIIELNNNSLNKFNSKSFKKDMYGPNMKCKISLLKRLKKFDSLEKSVYIKMEALINGFAEDDVSNSLSFLINRGYICEYRLENRNKTLIELTEKGTTVFESKESSAFLGVNRLSKDSRFPSVKDYKSLPYVILARSYYVSLQLSLFKTLNTIDNIIPETGCCVSNMKIEGNEAKNIFFICAPAKPSHVNDCRKRLIEVLNDDIIGSIFIIGYNFTQATAIFDWVTKNFKIDSRTSRLIYGLEENECREYETNRILSPDEVKNILSTNNFNDSDNLLQSNDIEKAVNIEQPEIDILVSDEIPTDIDVVNSTSNTVDSFEIVDQMLQTEQFYCASAYLYSLRKKDPEYEDRYISLAYAINDPLYSCTYDSNKILEAFFSNGDEILEPLAVSAGLRNFFRNDTEFDYQISLLAEKIYSTYTVKNDPDLFKVIHKLVSFKDNYHKGLDFYADYRYGNSDDYNSKVSKICEKAGELYNSYIVQDIKEKASNPRFIEMKKLMFEKGGDLEQYLDSVSKNNIEFIPLIKDYLVDVAIKDGREVFLDNIDNKKIEIFIDNYWSKAGQNMTKKMVSSNLYGNLKSNITSIIKNCFEVLIEYVQINEAMNSFGDKGYTAYINCRSSLLNDIESSIVKLTNEIDETNESGLYVLRFTLTDIKQCIEGSYKLDTRKFYYVDFLRTDDILLNDDYLPEFYNFEDIDELSPEKRILNHFYSTKVSFNDAINSIISVTDNYGSAKLIAEYLNLHPEISDCCTSIEDLEIKAAYPENDLEMKKNSFFKWIDLAQSFGQIDSSRLDIKERIIQSIDFWYYITIDTKNFGFFNKIINAYKAKIKDDAKLNGDILSKRVEDYKIIHPEWKDNIHVKEAISVIQNRIETQNYTAAEDKINRLLDGDFESESPFIDSDEDVLSTFINEYDQLYNKTRDVNKLLKNLVDTKRFKNKDIRGADRLLDNWPSGKGTSPDKIEALLCSLGFKVENNGVQKQGDIEGNESFTVTLCKPNNGKKSNYNHPIYIFGSVGEIKGFRVVSIFNKADPKRLLEIFKKIGNTKNTIILLNNPLHLSEKRELARKIKKEYNGATFLVIDRVVMAFIAKHYQDVTVNRLLMNITMPFAAFQPYISESATPMPPELFMGRKDELEKIEQPYGVNIVFGGRQLGKSALLRMAQKDINNNENGDRALLVEIKDLDYKEAALKVSKQLYREGFYKKENTTDDWNIIAEDIKDFLAENESIYFLLLLDEADTMIASCESIGYKPFNALKDIQQIGTNRFKFVVAGLRNTIRFNKSIALGNNSVLAHLSSMTIKPFKPTEARQLLEEPLSYLGFRFADDDNTNALISVIFSTTNYFPGLLQLYCSKLIGALKKDYAGYMEADTPPYYVTESHIQEVLADNELLEQIKEKFEITLGVGEDDYYYIIALLMVYKHHQGLEVCATPNEIIELAKNQEISSISSLSKESIKSLMDEMRELNILSLDNDTYRFARHNFIGLMGKKEEIEDAILSKAVADNS